MRVLTRGVSVLAAASLLLLGVSAATGWAAPSSVDAAYTHLDEAMDEWGGPGDLRLPSSYRAGFLDFWDNSVTYDNALVVIAYANRTEHPASLERAKQLGDALLQAQVRDPIGDGRLRNAYGPEQLWDPEGRPNIQTAGSASGNQAWAGMAFAHLAYVTGETKYLDGAERVGDWLIRETRDERGNGGFTGGYNSDGSKIRWKSAEHNVDMIGLFGMLEQLTGDNKWHKAKAEAGDFVRSMWLPEEGRFAIGTKVDGVTVNNDEYIPEDVQSWALLAFRDIEFQSGLQWNLDHLQVTDATNPEVPITGVRFALQTNPDQLDHNDDTVWLEGTAHMALAMKCTHDSVMADRADTYLRSLELAQVAGPNADGKGIQANSSEGYAGGDDVNYTSLHTGATSWYLFAKQGINPFHLEQRC